MLTFVKTVGTWRIALLSLFAVAILLLTVYGYQRNGREIMDHGNGKGSALLHTQIPPIDRAVPAKVETATFALG